MLNSGGGVMVSASCCPTTSGASLTLCLEKLLAHAQTTGELILCARNLKDFPKHGCKFSLHDTVSADLSRNKLSELPQECTDFSLLERLVLYNNTIRAIPDSITCLQSLQFLDLSRNQLSYLPATICELPLQALVVNNNRLVSLPEEIGKMQTLMELDASCNEIAHLPVQIGDLASLKSLNLRRNHLQEVPVEISYLQLTFLDLSGNRITALPVELRFMTTVIELNLGENPMSCPPANLCSRGKVHIFKYLEIQAIKEDRKRGVVTDSEYRRSYRKSAQLSDFRFASGFGADARRKRHTADSGYGSEQPLDRRWSQEFGHENGDLTSTEEARRLILRAANCPRSPRGLNSLTPSTNYPRVADKFSKIPGLSDRSEQQPLCSNVSSSSSSGYSSMNTNDFVVGAQTQLLSVTSAHLSSGSSSSCSPTSSSMSNNTNNDRSSPSEAYHDRPLKEKHTSLSEEALTSSKSGSDPIMQKSMAATASSATQLTSSLNLANCSMAAKPLSDVPDDNEKEERRRAAQMVFGKQGCGLALTQDRVSKCPSASNRHTQPLPVPNSSTKQPLPMPHAANSMLPVPLSNPVSSTSSFQPPKPLQSVSSYRQYRDQLRQHRHYQTPLAPSTLTKPYGHLNGSAPSISGTSQGQLPVKGGTDARSYSDSPAKSLFDMKTMQKEAVLSFVKSKQQQQQQQQLNSPARNHVMPDPESRSIYGHVGQVKTHIPLPSTSSTSSASSIASNASANLRYGGKIPQNKVSFGTLDSHKMPAPSASSIYSARRDAEKSATADSHIHQLRMQIESRLRITLPDDMAAALVDGVILCHIANHVKPRSIPSIHVPSPSAPKLTAAKCRRNVENFLLACRKIGVREEELFEVDDLCPASVLALVKALLDCAEFIDEPQDIIHYPDLVPKCVPTTGSRCHETAEVVTHSNLGQSLSLLTLLLATVLFLIFARPNPTA